MTEYLEAQFEQLRKQTDPLDEDTIELLMAELDKQLFKMNKTCNIMLNRPKGLHEAVLNELQNIKISLSTIRWYREQKNIEKLGLGEILHHAGHLAAAHVEEMNELGDVARRLLLLLPDGQP